MVTQVQGGVTDDVPSLNSVQCSAVSSHPPRAEVLSTDFQQDKILKNFRMTGTASLVAMFLCCMGSSSALVWRSAPNGEVPKNAVTYKHWDLYHFCRPINSKDRKTYTGVHRASENVCRFIAHGIQKEETEFEVLVEQPEAEEAHSWKYDAAIPANAASCEHDGIEECYLGLSIYGDGVCEEGIGTIDLKARLITFARDGEVQRCPFFMYLVQGGDKKEP